MAVNNPYTWGLGRRKSSIARVRIKPGDGAFVINGRAMDEYFSTLQYRQRAEAPLKATETAGTYDIFVNVKGGGVTGQSDAVSLGIARALKVVNPGFDEVLRAKGLLTRDARAVERKKYGRRGARRGSLAHLPTPCGRRSGDSRPCSVGARPCPRCTKVVSYRLPGASVAPTTTPWLATHTQQTSSTARTRWMPSAPRYSTS